MLISGIFIIAVVAVSILIFCRRDILVYDDKYGYLGVFVLCFICNATVFAPAPSLIVAVTAAQTLQPIPVILLGAAGKLGERLYKRMDAQYLGFLAMVQLRYSFLPLFRYLFLI